MPLSAKFNKLINDPEFVAKFEKAVEAQRVYWDALSELETEVGQDVEGEDFQHFESGDVLAFLDGLDQEEQDE
jgi:hypothetical protein